MSQGDGFVIVNEGTISASTSTEEIITLPTDSHVTITTISMYAENLGLNGAMIIGPYDTSSSTKLYDGRIGPYLYGDEDVNTKDTNVNIMLSDPITLSVTIDNRDSYDRTYAYAIHGVEHK